MRILIFNWRDIKNPQSGGAEILTHEIAKRWVKWGHSVTQFSSLYSGAKKEEFVDGVKIVRRGSANIRSLNIPIHVAVLVWYLAKAKGAYDMIIDEIHGFPFFTPLYVREKKVALICEVAGDLWDVFFISPFSNIGRFVEAYYFKLYKNIPFLTISNSTKSELIKMGVNAKRITVLPMGLSLPSKIKIYPKEKHPTVIFVGRLAKSKGVEDAIEAVNTISKHNNNIKLWIVGRGDKEYVNKLKNMALHLGIDSKITFWGYVSQEKKFELMSRAHVLLVPSSKEGWGLIVPEAGRVGTPSVVYNVSGLRDVTKHKVSGIIVDQNPKSMFDAVLELLKNKNSYQKLVKGAREEAYKKDWNRTADTALEVIKRVYED